MKKHIKFTLLTVFLISISLIFSIIGISFAAVAEVMKLIRFKSAYHLFHYVTISVIDFSLQSFDVADAIMGHHTLDYFKIGFGTLKQEFSVNYYTASYTNLHSTVCSAHCKTCAVHAGYHNRAAGYAHVEVEVIL